MQGVTELVGASFPDAPIGVHGATLKNEIINDLAVRELITFFAQSPSVNTTELGIKVVVVLGVTAGLLLVVTHFLKKMGYGTGAPMSTKAGNQPSTRKRRGNGQSTPAISVEHIMPITRQAKVATINVEGHRLVVGITDQQVSLLKDLSEQAANRAENDPVTGELERYPIDPAIIRAAQLRSRRAD